MADRCQRKSVTITVEILGSLPYLKHSSTVGGIASASSRDMLSIERVAGMLH